MNKIIEEDIKLYEHKIEQLRTMDEDLNLVEELLPDASIYLDYEINVNQVCNSMEQVKNVLKIFAKKGVLLKEHRPSDTSPI